MKIRELRVRAVRVPMQHPHQTASGVISESPLVLTDVVTERRRGGHSIIFTYTTAALKPTADLIQNLAPLVKGEPLAPARSSRSLPAASACWARRDWSGWRSRRSIWRCGMRWRASAYRRSRACSAASRGRCQAYGAVGYDGAVGSAEGRRGLGGSAGFTGVKAKIGYPTVAEDIAVIRAIRNAVGPDSRDHGGLQPVPHASRRDRAAAARRRRRPHLGRGADAGPRLPGPCARRARDPHTHPVRRKLVGAVPTCGTPSKRAPPTT